MMRATLIITVIFCSFSTSMIKASDVADGTSGDSAYGEYLAAECATCHSSDNDVPQIQGIDKDYFLQAMKGYQSGERQHDIMQSVAQSLGQEELDALAVYLSSLKFE